MERVLITAPAAEPVTLDTAKGQLRVNHTDEDSLIDLCIQAAREWAESYTDRALITQTWDVFFREWPAGDVLELPMPPMQSITEVAYTDTAGNETIWPAANYQVDTKSAVGQLVLKYGNSWPSASLAPGNIPIRIQITAGYGDNPANVPARIRQGMLNYIATLYEFRESLEAGRAIAEIPPPFSAKACLTPYRIWWRK